MGREDPFCKLTEDYDLLNFSQLNVLPMILKAYYALLLEFSIIDDTHCLVENPLNLCLLLLKTLLDNFQLALELIQTVSFLWNQRS